MKKLKVWYYETFIGDGINTVVLKAMSRSLSLVIENANKYIKLYFWQLLVLKYVQNKDVFMRYHKAHLTRRLILDISADSEIEENMVEWLRVSSVTSFFGCASHHVLVIN